MVGKRSSIVAVLAAFGLAGAQANSPRIEGELLPGTQAGSVVAESGPWGTPDRWSFWTFHLSFNQLATIEVTPQSRDHDVFIAVWYGIEADTRSYFDMTSGSLNTVFVASADAAGPGQPDGAGHPARLSFANTFGTQPFALAVADYVDARGQGWLPYQVTLVVPEPSTWVLFGLGLGFAGLVARQRKA